ncbi:DUF6563 family protein [Bacteroides bouchesdurhonensis]|uniref:DUF6563 family protein n=1 Tax=Bacteroides bouchesdurhonensis TaxID=1841855 RepID=UPI00097F970B|nr:DUF6563 family protein [Bacteroides bouchesdurhonensis]
MKRRYILWLLLGAISLPSIAQNVIYSNLKQLLTQDGDTVAVLRVEKRSRNQIVLSGGADYRITVAEDESMCRLLKKRCFAVRTNEGDLYVNCRKLRYKKLRFGAWYAPAVQLGNNIYFCAMPLGSKIGENFVEADDVKLGGNVGDALAASGLVTKRVCYVLNGETGKIDFLGQEEMLKLLKKYPDWKEAYLNEGSQEAENTFKYLLMLQKQKK